MEIIQRGQVFRGEPGTDRRSCAFPGVCVLPTGRWLVSCRAAPAKSATRGQHVLLSWSDDEGRSWSKPSAPFAPARVEGKPGLFRAAYATDAGGDEILAALVWVDHSVPALPFFNEKTEGLLDTRIFLARSRDGGETWSSPELTDTAPFRVPTPLTGPVLVLPDGRWACQLELNKHYYDAAPWRHSSVMIFSSDKGKTWPESAIVSSDPENRFFYWDQRPAVLPDGRILNFFWTYDSREAVYLPIHARESADGGRTWSEMWDTRVPGQPAAPVSLSGAIAMVYVDRTSAPVIKMRLSLDGGRTWPRASEEVLYRADLPAQSESKNSMQDAWSEMGKFSVGLPATAQLSENEFLVVYYAGSETDLTDIEWLRIKSGA